MLYCLTFRKEISNLQLRIKDSFRYLVNFHQTQFNNVLKVQKGNNFNQVLYYFNGLSPKCTISLKQLEDIIPKAVKYLKISQHNFAKYFAEFNIVKEQFVVPFLEILHQLNFNYREEKKFQKQDINSQEQSSQSLKSYQNIFRGIGGFKILNNLIMNQNELRNEDIISQFYQEFFLLIYYLTKNNFENSIAFDNQEQCVSLASQKVSKIVSFLEIKSNKKPIRISKLFKNLIFTFNEQQERINIVFSKIEQISVKLYSEDQFCFKDDDQCQSNFFTEVLIECIKTLNNILTRIELKEENFRQRQEFIASKLLSNTFLVMILKSHNFVWLFKGQKKGQKKEEKVKFADQCNQRMRLKRNLIILACNCFQFNFSLALELKRIISCQDLQILAKNSDIPNKLRQSYFQYLFKFYEICQNNAEDEIITQKEILDLMSLVIKEWQFCSKSIAENFQQLKQNEFAQNCLNNEIPFQVNHQNDRSNLFVNLAQKKLKAKWKIIFSKGILQIMFGFLSIVLKNYTKTCLFGAYNEYLQKIVEDINQMISVLENVAELEIQHLWRKKIRKALDELLFFKMTAQSLDTKSTCQFQVRLNYLNITLSNLNNVLAQTSSEKNTQFEQNIQVFCKFYQIHQDLNKYNELKKYILEFESSNPLEFYNFTNHNIFYASDLIFKYSRTIDLQISQWSYKQCSINLKEIYYTNYIFFLQFHGAMQYYNQQFRALWQVIRLDLYQVLLNQEEVNVELLSVIFRYACLAKKKQLQEEFGHLIQYDCIEKENFQNLLKNILKSFFKNNLRKSERTLWNNLMNFLQKLCHNNKCFQSILIEIEDANSQKTSILFEIIEIISQSLEKVQDENLFSILECGFDLLITLAQRNKQISSQICKNIKFMTLLNSQIALQNVSEILQQEEDQIRNSFLLELKMIKTIVQFLLVLAKVHQSQLNAILILFYFQQMVVLIEYSKCLLKIQQLKSHSEIKYDVDMICEDIFILCCYLNKNKKIRNELDSNLMDLVSGDFLSQIEEFQLPSFLIRKDVYEVEILNENQEIEALYYIQKPRFQYLSPIIKNYIMQGNEKINNKQRMQRFMKYCSVYDAQIQLQNSQSEFHYLLKFFINHWKTLNNIAYFLYLVMVVIFLIQFDENSQISFEQDLLMEFKKIPSLNITYNIINTIILILSLITFIFSLNERVIILFQKFFEVYNGGFYSLIAIFVYIFSSCCYHLTIHTILSLVSDFENLYNLTKIILIISCYFNPYIYGLLLLDIIKQSQDLQLIIQSLTLSGMNLLKFSYLALVCLMIYSFIAFSYFKTMFNEQNGVYAQTIIQAITTTINFGLRSGGGIGDVLENYQDPDSGQYWSRYFFDLSFFIIFNMLFFQILFGIIIDTFGELRAQRQELTREVKEKCLICGIDKGEVNHEINIEIYFSQNEWNYHITNKHNVHSYLYFMLEISKLQDDNCNSLESYIQKCIKNQDLSFLPQANAVEKQ